MFGFCASYLSSRGVKRRRIYIENALRKMKQFYVYIMTNRSKTLYIGVTNDLWRRVYEHKNKLIEGFTKKYNLNKLVYYEIHNEINRGILREKQLKGWSRIKKIKLIESQNPFWLDLSDDWYN